MPLLMTYLKRTKTDVQTDNLKMYRSRLETRIYVALLVQTSDWQGQAKG